jgi:hypothetical protein
MAAIRSGSRAESFHRIHASAGFSQRFFSGDRECEGDTGDIILVNSATYVYTNDQAYFFRNPLYAFVTLDPKGEMVIGGRTSVYRTVAPDVVSARFPTRISNHTLQLL